jgi:hypothetical protein
VNAAQSALFEGVRKEINGIAPSTPAGDARRVERLAAMFAEFARSMKAITPPSNVADLHAQLVSRLEGVTHKLEASAQDIRAGHQQAATDASAQIEQIAIGPYETVLAQINTELGFPAAHPQTVPISPTGDEGTGTSP